MQQIRGWVRPPISLGNQCHLIQASPGGMLLLQIHYSQGGCQTAFWHRGGRLDMGRLSWEGSGSRSHRGFAKWWWVMSAVWGGEGIMADWEYRGSVVHTILIHSYQKKAKRCLLFSWRDLHITRVDSTDKTVPRCSARGDALIFKG